MSLLYRAIWRDDEITDRSGAVALARDCLSRWAMETDYVGELADGQHDVVLAGANPRTRTVHLRTVETAELTGFEAIVRDRPSADTATHRTTAVRVGATSTSVFSWVENAVETDDPVLRVKVGRPRVVDELLTLSTKPVTGHSAVLTSAVAVAPAEAAALREVLRDSRRTLPYVVFTQPLQGDVTDWLRLAEQTATRSAGVAVVVTLDRSAAAEFRKELGDLAVWNGAVRIYASGPLESRADGYRHRYLLPHRFAPATAVDRLVFSVAQQSTRRPVPDALRVFLEPGPSNLGQPLPDASMVDVDELEFDLLQAQEDLDTVTRELAVAQGHLQRLDTTLRERGLGDLFWTTQSQPEDADELPDQVQATSDAVFTAQQHLAEWVNIPDEAVRALDGIDSGPNSYSWGNKTWQGLRALALFAEARASGFQGDFWLWCQSGHPLGWPASTKKLAMSESETVQKNEKFMKAREFPVSVDVVSTGRVRMQAHLKISEGGGDLAPRIYFYDDTTGRTRKVHVGFVGPHYLVPNTKS
jgi:hypothetical protein